RLRADLARDREQLIEPAARARAEPAGDRRRLALRRVRRDRRQLEQRLALGGVGSGHAEALAEGRQPLVTVHVVTSPPIPRAGTPDAPAGPADSSTPLARQRRGAAAPGRAPAAPAPDAARAARRAPSRTAPARKPRARLPARSVTSPTLATTARSNPPRTRLASSPCSKPV